MPDILVSDGELCGLLIVSRRTVYEHAQKNADPDMKSGLFCHIHTLQYCGNRLLLGQSLPGIVLRGKAQLGVEQALCFKITDEIQCGKL